MNPFVPIEQQKKKCVVFVFGSCGSNLLAKSLVCRFCEITLTKEKVCCVCIWYCVCVIYAKFGIVFVLYAMFGITYILTRRRSKLGLYNNFGVLLIWEFR